MGFVGQPIVGRDRPFEVDPARFDHFQLGEGKPVAADELVRDPAWTLYTIDPDHDRAMLVRLPDGLDLTAQPFAFVAQFDHATDAVVLPLDDLARLADDLPRPATLVHLFSTGRCGSTLASRIFAELDGVWSLSEPDAIAQLVVRRDEYGTRRMQEMLRVATRWSFRPVDPRPDTTCVLKYRSEALFDAADFVTATPDSTSLFLYRDVEGWVDSGYRFGQKQGADVGEGSTAMRDFLWHILSAGAPPGVVADICDPVDPATPMETALAALWAMRIEAYQAAAATGVPFHPFSYRDINHDREATVARLLQVLGHDSPSNRERALRAYDVDSQQGTDGNRDAAAEPLPADRRQRVHSLVADNARMRAAVDAMR
ncbi:hypothetical protein BDK89_4042 [Ilumatobacter fluminis]|uniref:Sulfotransferase family protein n=1 Tax=Ilumatobacter fluminis TaxID=467091 RepID=A0A4R7I431_9ACTN|nr:hypothetical protein [Ilumatobacter fluminis]TDT18422.1 hypothetical protein BDK89_4042 [Ilumatobacter fluminis]